MQFTWDENKATSNQREHGVSFVEAKSIFDDPQALRIFDPDHSESEDHFILLGMSSALRILLVCHCYRAKDQGIRIISARKATRKKREFYTRGM